MQTLSIFAFAAFVSFALASDRLADISITDDNTSGTKDCGGGKASIVSNKNSLTLKNCVTVSVAGNDNSASLDGSNALSIAGNRNTVKAGLVKSINLIGNKNTVTYKLGPKNEKPSISDVGTGNTVSAE
jgi:hypothetical protein